MENEMLDKQSTIIKFIKTTQRGKTNGHVHWGRLDADKQIMQK